MLAVKRAARASPSAYAAGWRSRHNASRPTAWLASPLAERHQRGAVSNVERSTHEAASRGRRRGRGLAILLRASAIESAGARQADRRERHGRSDQTQIAGAYLLGWRAFPQGIFKDTLKRKLTQGLFFSEAMPLLPRQPWPSARRPERPPRTPRVRPGGLRTAQHVSWSQPAGIWLPTARVHARRRAPPPAQVMRRRRCRVARGVACHCWWLDERRLRVRSSLPAAGHVHHRRSHRDQLRGGVVPMPRCLVSTALRSGLR